MTIAAIILAAGASRRLGRPKQLLSIGCVPLVRRIAECARGACDAACVVVGADADRVSAAVIGLDVTTVHAEDWAEGMAASLRRGVAWASAAGHDAIAIFTCDQPRLSLDHATTLVASYRASRDAATTIVASQYGGTRGVPAVFGRARYPELLAQRGDRGARALLRSDRDVIVVDWPDGAFDIDTPADLASLRSS